MLRPIPRNQNPESHIVTTVDKEGFLTHEWQMLHSECARPSVLRTRQHDLSNRPKRAHEDQTTDIKVSSLLQVLG